MYIYSSTYINKTQQVCLSYKSLQRVKIKKFDKIEPKTKKFFYIYA